MTILNIRIKYKYDVKKSHIDLKISFATSAMSVQIMNFSVYMECEIWSQSVGYESVARRYIPYGSLQNMINFWMQNTSAKMLWHNLYYKFVYIYK